MSTSEKLELLRSSIASFEDFPIKGVNFKDIFSVFKSPEAFSALFDLVRENARSFAGKVDVVVGLDARGFLFGPLMAAELKLPFVPVRKSGKLPGPCHQVEYSLEYGKASIEIQADAVTAGKRVLIVDDLLATGGTLAAAVKLVQKCGGLVSHCFVVMELDFLRGRQKLPSGVQLISLINYDQE